MTETQIHCVKPEPKLEWLSLFFLIFNHRLMQPGDMSDVSHGILLYILWFNEQLLPKLPCNGDSKGPEI